MTHRRPILRRRIWSGIVALLLGAALSFPAPALAAKTGPTTEPRMLGRLDDILDGLNLTPDQKQQVDQVRQEAAETLRPLAKQLKDLPPDERRQKIQDALGGVKDQLKSILTPDQMSQLATKLQAGREGGAGAGEGRRRLDKNDHAATTQPAAGAPRGPMIQKLSDALDKLDLTADQKTKTDAALATLTDKVKQIRATAAQDQQSARQQARAAFQDTHTQLKTILTPDQLQKLAELMPRGQRGAGADTPNNKSDPPSRGSNTSNTPDPTAAKAAAASSSDTNMADDVDADGPLAVGDQASDFKVYRTSEGTASLHNFVGEPLVMIFGSYTSPSFRDHAAMIDALRNRYHYRVNFLVVYTREAHATGEWEVARNMTDGINVAQPKTLAQRMDIAKRSRRALNMLTEMAVDDVDDATAKAYQLGTDGAAVISPTGTIVGTQKWCDPYGLAAMIDTALRPQVAKHH